MSTATIQITPAPVGITPCLGRQDIFYGKVAERPQARVRREAKAKEMCATCPQMERCRDYARTNRETFGVWGGETEVERWNGGYMGTILPNHLCHTAGIVKRR